MAILANRSPDSIKGGKARAEKLTSKQREEIARKAAKTHWEKSKISNITMGSFRLWLMAYNRIWYSCFVTVDST